MCEDKMDQSNSQFELENYSGSPLKLDLYSDDKVVFQEPILEIC